MNEPDPRFPYPQVHLVVEVDLTSHRYRDRRDVLADLDQQARFTPEGCDVEVRLGTTALRLGAYELDWHIAGAFYLTASNITVKVPGGTRSAAWLAANITRHVRAMREDHARTLAERPASTG
ncbi:hypothetical protein [Streptomyces sp. NPDC005970]|uniref:hypothetical protein n=1 Tax=Streptomyces sp. NPDC005970 TaxID=3156723 RepID=UPI0033F2E083